MINSTIDAAEFMRYLVWRVAIHIGSEQFDELMDRFGDDPILVDGNGKLSSPGGRGAL
jgi:hypothetical protein